MVLSPFIGNNLFFYLNSNYILSGWEDISLHPEGSNYRSQRIWECYIDVNPTYMTSTKHHFLVL